MSDDQSTDVPAAGRSFPLRQHHLPYFSDLHVGEELFEARFAHDADSSRCSAHCCRAGVLMDIAHRDRVLAEAPLILQYMEPGQERDPSRWFYDADEEDIDFPSRRAINTAIVNDTCVFLDSQKRCVLQRAEERSPGLKPFYCRAFPIVIVEGRLTLNCDHCPNDTQCCGIVADGDRTTEEVFGFELTHVLGGDGVRELERARADWEQTKG